MKIIVGALAFLSFVIACSQQAFACTCAERSTVQNFSSADAIFLGSLVSLDEPKQYEGLITNMALFKISKQWKGAAASSAKIAWAFDVPGQCGDVPLETGKTYLVYASRERVRYNGRYSYELTVRPDCGPSHGISERRQQASDAQQLELAELNRLSRSHR